MQEGGKAPAGHLGIPDKDSLLVCKGVCVCVLLFSLKWLQDHKDMRAGAQANFLFSCEIIRTPPPSVHLSVLTYL